MRYDRHAKLRSGPVTWSEIAQLAFVWAVQAEHARRDALENVWMRQHDPKQYDHMVAFWERRVKLLTMWSDMAELAHLDISLRDAIRDAWAAHRARCTPRRSATDNEAAGDA